VSFVDDDEVVDERWAAAILDGFLRFADLTGLFGPVAPRDDRGLAYCYQESSDFSIFHDPATAPWLVGTGGNMAFDRERLVRAGAFDPLFGPGAPALAADDHEVIVRLLRAGHTLARSPAMVVYHPTKTAGERLASRYPYGYSAGKVARRHRDLRLAARYARNTSQVIAGGVARRDARRRREGIETLRGFLAAALVASRPLSPPRVLERMPPAVLERIAAGAPDPLPLRLRPDPHYLYACGTDTILHVYVNPSAPLRRALAERERIKAETAMPGIPRLEALGESIDALWVLEERLDGEHPQREKVKAWFPAVAEWSVRLAVPGGPRLEDTEGWDTLCGRLLEFCPGVLRRALERSLGTVRTLPSRHTHGDLAPKNVLLGKGSNPDVGVLDWEHLRYHGIPGRDLIFLATTAGNRPPDTSVVHGLARNGEIPWSPIRPHLRRAGLPDEALRPTLLVLLALWAAHEAERLATPGRVARDTPYLELLLGCGPYVGSALT
jgi:hypothetical protein